MSVVQSLLNFPGLSAVALLDGRQRLGWVGRQLNLADQRQAGLAQGIQQVVETAPAGFDSFSFYFRNYLVYLHRLGLEQVLLMLIADGHQHQDHSLALTQLQATLLKEPDILDSLTQTLALWEDPSSAADEATLVGLVSQPPPDAASVDQISLEEMIEALNRVSEGATPYLGKIIVANTWKQSRPAHPWLTQFDIQKDGHFAMVPPAAEPLTAEQQQWIRDWVVAFVERGGRTIRNFQGLVSDHVSPQDRALLFG